MNKENFSQNREEKILERCEILASLISGIKGEYNKETTSEYQKAFIETTIGAALWYLPEPEYSFAGYISKNCLESLKEEKPKISKEHIFPRKLSAKSLLIEKVNLDGNQLFELYIKKYCKLCYITPEENKKATKYQKDGDFDPKNLLKVYNETGIELIKISSKEFEVLRKNKSSGDTFKKLFTELSKRRAVSEIKL